jgi:hypothetical protein
MGKYTTIIPLSKALLKQSYIEIAGDPQNVNYRNLQRDEIIVKKNIRLLLQDTDKTVLPNTSVTAN